MRCISFIPLLASAALFASATPALPESTRVLRSEVPAGAPFAVENLAGRMRVRTGSGDRAGVVATVHAETEELATRFRLETVSGRDGLPTVRVRYPDGEDSIRYRPARGENDERFLSDLFSDSFDGSHRYDGRKFRVSSSRGRLLYADLDVELPRPDLVAGFRNLIGTLSASDLSGRFSFEVDSADVRLDRLKGEVRVRSSSGDVVASDVSGSWTSDSSSGDIVLDRFSGESVAFHSSSGDIRMRTVDAARLSLETSSGDLKISDADIAEVVAHTGSGDMDIEARGRRLARLRARTGSGDVLLRLPGDASFDAHAVLSSGDMHVGFSDGTATRKDGDLIAYRRGTGSAKIEVETGSGNLTIDPR